MAGESKSSQRVDQSGPLPLYLPTNGNGDPGIPANGKLFEVETTRPAFIVKRDGRVVPFEARRIEVAITKCFNSLGRRPTTGFAELTRQAVNIIAVRYAQPTVEEVQDIVEMVLQAAGEYDAAKHYILYRAEHAKLRKERPVPEEVRAKFDESDAFFPTQLQKFQFYDKYSRFNYELGRRETWVETVDRAVDFLKELAAGRLPGATFDRVRRGILEMRAMPSMRLLAMAGPAARRNNITVYNCSYLPVESIDAFVEALIISMSGCGVGFSVERRYVENFPRVRRQRPGKPGLFVVEDSAEGWAEALRTGLQTWFDGGDIRFDLSLVRPAGLPLRTKGGRASGPEPLRKMLDFSRSRILARQGSFLRPLDAHDLMCAVGGAAVSGGMRRCMPAGTRIHLQRGAVPIEQVAVGDMVMTVDGYRTVTGWVEQGEQPVVEIVTESGTIFRCTPHHRVAVLTDVYGDYAFKYAGDLTAEDKLLFITHPIDGDGSLDLSPLPEKRPADHSGSLVKQPHLTVETAWFMGKFFADGYVYVGAHDGEGKKGNTLVQVALHQNEQMQIERVARWFSDHGLPPYLLCPDEEKTAKVSSNNRQFARWISEYKQPKRSLVIPEAVWRASIDVRAAFLAGVMDGDGTYSDRPITVVSTIYENFARDVVKLLATLGIVAEVRVRRPTDPVKGWKALWIVTVKDTNAIQRASELIGKHSVGKWLARRGKQSGYGLPAWMVVRDLPRSAYQGVFASSTRKQMNSATLATITKRDHFVPVSVREVRPGGVAATYDIEVAEGAMFVAEGYLVHNTAMISLFDFDDAEMRHCKDGDFDASNNQRWNANNSAVWPEDGLTQVEVARYMLGMVESGRGEPGIFSRSAANKMRPDRREAAEFGTNPCGEISLRPFEFCNLSIAVARAEDTYESLRDKVELAAIIGTIQSLATYFPGLRPIWQKNCEDERLLGVDINGQLDSPVAQDPAVQDRLRMVALEVNRATAAALGINQSASVTCVKPSGNSSQLLDCSPGIHTRWAPYYIRNVRVGAHTPVFKVLRDAGVPMNPENGQTPETADTWVVHFPVKAPDGAITRKERSALQQCEYWLQNKLHWTEHNPSVTITYHPDEVLDLVKWVWEHQDIIGGMAFLPALDAQYDQMPYMEIEAAEYERLAAEFPAIDFSKIYRYEEEDYTKAAQELACMSGLCLIE